MTTTPLEVHRSQENWGRGEATERGRQATTAAKTMMMLLLCVVDLISIYESQ